MRRADLDTAEIVRLYESGKRGSEIALLLGCSTETVYARLAAAGIDRTRRARLDPERLRSLYVDDRQSLTAIGAALGVSGATVRSHLMRLGVPLRSRIEALQPTGRLPCPRSLVLRGYLLGFAWGDLAVERAGPQSQTVLVRSSTTHAEQVRLLVEMFDPWGIVRVTAKARVTQVVVSLDDSFRFLMEKYAGCVPDWVDAADVQAAFVAGYVDAEGSFGVYGGRGRFKIDSYDASVLRWIDDWCRRNGIASRHRQLAAAGTARADGLTYNGDLWRVVVSEKFGLLRLAATLEPYIRHERRRARMAAVVANVTDRLRARVLI